MGEKKFPWCFLNKSPSISFKTSPNKLLASSAYEIVPTEIHITFYKSVHKKELHSETVNDTLLRFKFPSKHTFSPRNSNHPFNFSSGYFFSFRHCIVDLSI